MNYWSISAKRLLEYQRTSVKGLTEQEAEKRLFTNGPNEIKKEKAISPLKIFLRQFTNVLIIILLIATMVAAVIGDVIDAALIFIVVVINAIFGFVQEYRAEKAIEALRRMTALHVTVFRSSKLHEIDATKLVPGDIVELVEGERVPADCRILESINLQADESMLTGESTPVDKKNIEVHNDRIGDRVNALFAGTIIIRGHAKAVVAATGMGTEVGKIAKQIEMPSQPTPLQIYLDQFGKKLGIMIAIGTIVLFIVGSLVEDDFFTLFMTSVSMAAAAIPEGLPAIVTLSLAFGARKMASKNAIMRRLSAVESLGSTTMICTDKTGTLTENKMTVEKVYCNGKIKNVYNAKNDMLFRIGFVCNNSVLDKVNPTETALVNAAKTAGLDEKEYFDYHRLNEIPFSSKTKMMTVLCRKDEEDIVFMKGAPYVVLSKCDRILENNRIEKLSLKKRDEIDEAVDSMAKNALRVLAVAYKTGDCAKMDEGLIFVGLLGMMDPPRKEVRGAIAACKGAGIKVVIITGDHALTAKAVAESIGIDVENMMLGDEVERLPFEELKERVKKITIFARVDPSHKSRIVKAFQANGEVVAVTGDGVNDAPALKNADIGIAMGIRGTDVAKEAADMVITDDNFSTIVSAIEEGRRIFDNIRKAILYLLSSNLGEVLTVFLASVFLLPLPLTAAQILWINLLSDGFPALALGVDPVHPKAMKRRPEKANGEILNMNMILSIVRVGFLIAIAVVFLYLFYLQTDTLAKARTIAFTSLVMIEFVILQTVRQHFGQKLFANNHLSLSLVAVVVLQLLVIYSPLNVVFRTVPLNFHDWAIIGAAVGAVFLFNHAMYRFVKSE